ncbi:hypothetical protein RWE15_23810 [Virgibacillus halophilus]|uniref:Uncharacterized protein n=1 Tax=Tigheibacillus halophilus TaxID=361280 RepID=A0ABU5CBR1_9BACI|nr:hypothetical protein [Virgibacillus halophilus]
MTIHPPCTVSLQKRNVIKDHSFELVKTADDLQSDSVEHNWIDHGIDNDPYDKTNWETVGSPKVAVQFGPASKDGLPIFGDKAIVVRNAHYVRQYVFDGVGAGSKYTVSAHFKRQWKLDGGIPRIEIWHINAAGTRQSKIVNSTFDRVRDDYAFERHATTFEVPSSFGIGDSLEVIISGGDSNWVQCDGVQMIADEHAAVYQPEDSIWEITKGKYLIDFQQQSLWSGERYPTETQTITPSKALMDCQNGWVLEWSGYDKGDGLKQHNFQYTFIPKLHAWFNNSMGVIVNLQRDSNAVYKYLYIKNESFVGRSYNNNDKNSVLALRGVYEW